MAAVNLFELFNGKIFRIPDYQRGYAWERRQLLELWDDIEEIQSEKDEFKKHYTGTIYLEETTASENEKWLSGVKYYNVVDGQQRLTTISILLFELLKEAKDHGYCGETKEDLEKVYIFKTNTSGNSTVYRFSYATTNRNYNFLLKNIFERKTILLLEKGLNLYSKNLINAKTFFQEKMKYLNHAQKEVIYKKLTSSLQFDIRTIEKDLDVQAVFETMNNRGKPLTTLEKLKNRLIYLTEKLKTSEEDKRNLRNKINDAWGNIYLSLAQNPESILDEDVFLSAHLSLYRRPKEAVFSENLAEEKVFEMFCNKPEKYDLDESGVKEDPISYQKIENYIIKLSEAAPIWYLLHNSETPIIKRILLLNNSKEIKVFLLSLLLQSANQNLTSILEKLEKILFRNRVSWVVDERTPATWGRDLYNTEDSMESIGIKMQNLILTPIINANVIQSFTNLFSYEKGAKGYHRWGALKYFLFEFEEKLKIGYRETNDKVNIDDYEITTIEHIIPQQFTDNWSDVMNEFAKNIPTESLKQANKILLNSLGNLTILKDGKNSSLGNKGWNDKRLRFTTGSYNEINISQSQNWTEKEILKRGLDLIQFLEQKVEGLRLSNEEQYKILFAEDYVINKLVL